MGWHAKRSEAFRDHILPGSILVHDKETTHKKLVSELNLLSVDLKASQLKGLPDDENPLYPVNHAHFLLKRFLNAHSGFTRSELDGYLNLFAFVMNPPSDGLEKVETIIKMAFENPKLLRYRKAFRKNQGL